MLRNRRSTFFSAYNANWRKGDKMYGLKVRQKLFSEITQPKNLKKNGDESM